MIGFGTLDIVGIVFFAAAWVGYHYAVELGPHAAKSLNMRMNLRRATWVREAMARDNRIVDTQVMNGLQNGTAFFASTSLLAIGGTLALLNATDRAVAIFSDLPFVPATPRSVWELKIIGLVGIFGYAFFKFGWSYRLFNYCTILLGAMPMSGDIHKDPAGADLAADKVIRMNILAAKHFNKGLRAIFLSIGYLGWFVSPYLFIGTTIGIIIVLIRRQFYSEARLAVLENLD